MSATTTSTLELDQVPVGALHCQKDTFATTFTTTCIGCSEKPNKKGFYEVKLYDTSKSFSLFFPSSHILTAKNQFIYSFIS